MSILPYDKAWAMEPDPDGEEYELDDSLWPTLPEAISGVLTALSMVCWGLALATMVKWLPLQGWLIQLDVAFYDGQAVLRNLHMTVVCEVTGLFVGLALGLGGCALSRYSAWGIAAAVAAGLNALAAIVILAGWFIPGF